MLLLLYFVFDDLIRLEIFVFFVNTDTATDDLLLLVFSLSDDDDDDDVSVDCNEEDNVAVTSSDSCC